MKNTKYMILLLVVIGGMLTACNMDVDDKDTPSIGTGSQSPIEDSATPQVKGLENVDVLNTHGRIEGLESMQNFYNAVQNRIPSDLRVVHYTIEGDPLVTDLNYNGEDLEVKDDTTRDKFGNGEIRLDNCSNLIEEVYPTNTSYIAVDCNDSRFGMQEILRINYNMGQQDRFEFVLKYGAALENEINTTQVDVANITEENKQEVYKRLVFANYLADKDLTTTCDAEDPMNYFLKVHINSGQREFRWGACDQSIDGMEFTKIANYIIEQSEKIQSLKSETMVQGYVLERKNNTLLIGEDLNRLDYEWLKDELHDLDSYIFDFIILEGANTTGFNLGDKIQATIEDMDRDSKPGRAQVKEIKKIE